MLMTKMMQLVDRATGQQIAEFEGSGGRLSGKQLTLTVQQEGMEILDVVVLSAAIMEQRQHQRRSAAAAASGV